MSDVIVVDNQDVSTDDQKDGQAVTLEQFEALQIENIEVKKMLEEIKKTQSGSDRANTELKNLLKQKEDAKKTDEQKRNDDVAEIKAELAKSKAEAAFEKNKSLVTQMLTDANLSVPRGIGRLVGDTKEETLKYVKDYIEDRQDEEANKNSKIAKKFSRVVDATDKKSQDKMSWEDMNKLSNEDFEKLPKDLVKKTMEAAIGVNK